MRHPSEYFAHPVTLRTPPYYFNFLIEEFCSLSETLNDGPSETFSLEAHGHRMVVLEPDDNFRCLPIFAYGTTEFDLLESMPEYVELAPLEGGLSVYRICFMLDNECFLLMYILNDRLEPKLKRWLSEQTGHMAEEVLK